MSENKRVLIADCFQRNPEMSFRKIAKITGASYKYVSYVVGKLKNPEQGSGIKRVNRVGRVKCLKCDKKFTSPHVRQIRICPRCKKLQYESEKRSPYVSEYRVFLSSAFEGADE